MGQRAARSDRRGSGGSRRAQFFERSNHVQPSPDLRGRLRRSRIGSISLVRQVHRCRVACVESRFAEYFRGKSLHPRSGLFPIVAIELSLQARFFQKAFGRPAELLGYLRQQNASFAPSRNHQAVLSRLDLLATKFPRAVKAQKSQLQGLRVPEASSEQTGGHPAPLPSRNRQPPKPAHPSTQAAPRIPASAPAGAT